MKAIFICPANKAVECRGAGISNDAHIEADRAQRAKPCARCGQNPCLFRHFQGGNYARKFFRFKRVEAMVTSQHQGNDFALFAVYKQRFNGVGNGNSCLLDQVVNGFYSRRCKLY